jgi:hypothetical protein
MVARIQTHCGSLLVTLESGGEEQERHLASTGQRALVIALSMLARRDALRHGDKLTVTEARE